MFAKFIPLYIVLVTLGVSAFMAGQPRGKKAMRSLQIFMAIFILVWAYLCLRVYPNHVMIE